MSDRDQKGRFVKGMTPWCKNKTLTEDHKTKLRLSHIGKKQTPETIKKRAITMSKIMSGKIPIIYKNETIEQRKKRMYNMTLVRRLKSPYSQFPHSYNRVKEYHIMHDLIFGKNCYLCGSTEFRLELHHLWYEEYSYDHKGSDNIVRKIEAIQHPERFVRLCHVCHSAVTLVQTHGFKIIEGLEFLQTNSLLKQSLQEKIIDFYAK